MEKQTKLVNAKELAKILGVSYVWVQRAAKEGRIPGYKFFRDWRFDPEEVREALQKHKNIPLKRKE